jgi:hypothetical protein
VVVVGGSGSGGLPVWLSGGRGIRGVEGKRVSCLLDDDPA